MRKYSVFFFLIVLLLNSSCSHLRSGHYIKVEKGDTVEKLAKEYNVSASSIRSANPSAKFSKGEWVLIPLARGFLIKILEQIAKHRTEKPPTNDDSTGNGNEKMSKARFLWPVPSTQRISSYFGPRSGRNHDGLDIPAKTGTSIVAVESGTVIYSGNGIRGYGNLTIIAHSKTVHSVYAHASKNLTKKGKKVFRGQVIALVGSTGHSTGPHLHFEIRENNKPVDPLRYIPHPSRSLQLAKR